MIEDLDDIEATHVVGVIIAISIIIGVISFLFIGGGDSGLGGSADIDIVTDYEFGDAGQVSIEVTNNENVEELRLEGDLEGALGVSSGDSLDMVSEIGAVGYQSIPVEQDGDYVTPNGTIEVIAETPTEEEVVETIDVGFERPE